MEMASLGYHVHPLRIIGFVFAHFLFVAKSPSQARSAPRWCMASVHRSPIVANHPLVLSVRSLPTRTVRPFVLKQRGTKSICVILGHAPRRTEWHSVPRQEPVSSPNHARPFSLQTVGHHRVHAEDGRGRGSRGFCPARSFLGSRVLPVADLPRCIRCHSIHCCIFRMSLTRPAKSRPASKPALCG